jgi:hypothetical protein
MGGKVKLTLSNLNRIYSFFEGVDSVLYVSGASKPPTITAKFEDGKNVVNLGGKHVLVIVMEEPLTEKSGVFAIQSPNLDLPKQDTEQSGGQNALE